MTDRELLEKAASAIGIRLEWDGPPADWTPMYYQGKSYYNWNPLENDGDALRLAVKLHISIYADDESYVFGVTDRESEVGWCECWNDDPCAAARRAIVRAAANMPVSVNTSSTYEKEISPLLKAENAS